MSLGVRGGRCASVRRLAALGIANEGSANSHNEVRRIRAAFAAGTGLDELTARHSVANAVIRAVVTGATYSSAAGPTFEMGRSGRIARGTDGEGGGVVAAED